MVLNKGPHDKKQGVIVRAVQQFRLERGNVYRQIPGFRNPAGLTVFRFLQLNPDRQWAS
jgi:hypothetical protein